METVESGVETIDDLLAWIEEDDARAPAAVTPPPTSPLLTCTPVAAARARKLPCRLEDTSTLPVLARLPGTQLIYSRSAAEAEELCDQLELQVSGSGVCIGFDIEWRALMVTGMVPRKAATVQLWVPGVCIVLQLSAMAKFPARLTRLLEDGNTVKAGVGIVNDGIKLRRDFGVRCRGLLDLAGEIDSSSAV
jgi:hypothetical protein